MGAVVIGMDPHKRSATIEVMTGNESIVGGGRFATDAEGYRAMLNYAKQFPERTWAIEGCNGIGRHLAMRLLADGEQVVDVPPKLSARARVFATGQGRKTDATDAHSVALVGTRIAGLRPVVNDKQLTVLRVLADRRRALGEEHNRLIARLHHLLLELIPGGAKLHLSHMQARALLAKVRPRDAAGKAIRRVASELIGDLERNHERTKAADKELKQLLAETGTTLMQLRGIGPYNAARLLVEVGDVTRFPARRTSPPGPAPPPSTPPPATTSGTGSRGLETGRSTTCCTSWPSSNYATKPKDAPTSTARKTPARPRWKRCAASSDACPTSSTGNYSPTCSHQQGRAREGTRARHSHPAWPTHTPTSTLRISHFPDPPTTSLEPTSPRCLDVMKERGLCSWWSPRRTLEVFT